MSTIPVADLSLFLATSEQVLEARRRHAPTWCKTLSVEECLLRDVIMDKQEHATGGKGTTWILAPRADPTTLDFMCSCEVFRRTGIVTKPSHQATQATAFGIASVFTPAEKRKRGYGQHFMRLLHWVLAPRSALPDFPAQWGAPPAVPADLGLQSARWSVLYSDVGTSFYYACGPTAEPGNGWLERGSVETSWYADKAGPASGEEGGTTPPHIWLSEDDVKHVWALEAALMRADLERAAASTGHTPFSFLPNKGVGAFVIQRTMRIGADETVVLPLDTWGVLLLPSAVVGVDEVFADGERQPTFATWTLDSTEPSSRVLVVTHIRVSKDTLPPLVKLLIQFARKENVEKIEIWGLPESLWEAARELSWETVGRADHLSAFKWYGEESDKEVDWMFNEKFAWC